MRIEADSKFGTGEEAFLLEGTMVSKVLVDRVSFVMRHLYDVPIIMYDVKRADHSVLRGISQNALFTSPSEAFGIPTTEAYKVTIEKL